MLIPDEKRNYTRMQFNCDINYKLAGSYETHQARCTSISGSGLSFISKRAIEQGKALEIQITQHNSITPRMTAFIEVVRITPQFNDSYEIAAQIKSIKGN